MTDLLTLAAKAHYENDGPSPLFDELSFRNKDLHAARMRSALLALADEFDRKADEMALSAISTIVIDETRVTAKNLREVAGQG